MESFYPHAGFSAAAAASNERTGSLEASLNGGPERADLCPPLFACLWLRPCCDGLQSFRLLSQGSQPVLGCNPIEGAVSAGNSSFPRNPVRASRRRRPVGGPRATVRCYLTSGPQGPAGARLAQRRAPKPGRRRRPAGVACRRRRAVRRLAGRWRAGPRRVARLLRLLSDLHARLPHLHSDRAAGDGPAVGVRPRRGAPP